MMNQTEENYSFCPNCGALMEHGVCPECEKKRGQQGVYSSQQRPKEPHPGGQEPYYGPYPGQQNDSYGQQSAYGSQQNDPYGQQNAYGNQQNDPYGQQSPYGNWQNNSYGQQNVYGNQQSSPYGQQNTYANQKPPYYSPYNYQGQNYGYPPYQTPKKSNKVWIAVGIGAGVLVLFGYAVVSFFYGFYITKYVNGGMNSADWYAGEYDFGYDEDEAGAHDDPYGSDHTYEDGYGSDYVPSPDDQYYYGPCDAINEDVDYSFVTKSYTNEDAENDIDVIVNYVALKGDNIPNIDQLNEAIESVALYYAVDFPQYSYYGEYGDSYGVYITTYVTYNDEDMISIVLDEYVAVDGEYHVDLYPINIDVKNGVVLDNGSLLEIDTEFAGEFRKRNNEQNGNIDYLDSLTDEELAQALRDKQSVIAYYTPLGMEIGMNYNSSTSSGWLTVTYKDYEKYLTKF